MKTLLIDGDIILYRFAFRQQKEYDWGNGVTSKTVDAGQAKADALRFLKDLRVMMPWTDKHMIICFSGPSNECFRKQIMPSYKHNRKGCTKPDLYWELKDYLLSVFEWKEYNDLEADDCLGILATRRPGKYVVCTIDKDLKQIPGDHFNWDKDEFVRSVGVREANEYFYTQVLTGDPTDGYSGCPGIGAKKAAKILEGLIDPAEIWARIVETYAYFGLDESYALVQARMARILRACDYDFENKKPILWVPQVSS